MDATTERTGVRPPVIGRSTTGATTPGLITVGLTTTVRIKIAGITPDRMTGGFTTTVGMETATTGGIAPVRNSPLLCGSPTVIGPTVIARVGA